LVAAPSIVASKGRLNCCMVHVPNICQSIAFHTIPTTKQRAVFRD
jgi:hypothetical protein